VSERKVLKEIRIAASPDVVWKALTDAQELTRWFPLDARVKPGKGGSIWISWGPGFEGESKIEIWEPGRHLRKVSAPAGTEQKESTRPPFTVDFYLEGDGGTTILRLVQSGFGDGQDWDDEYDSIDTGWGLYLKNLRHCLERHRGASCVHRFEFLPPLAMSREQAWSRLETDLRLPKTPGAAFAVDVSSLKFQGLVEVSVPPSTIGLVVTSLNDSLLRIMLCAMHGKCFASFDVFGFGVESDRVDQLTKAVSTFLGKSLQTNV
jgi:uncharacterized protein YndB with AHSA1/START domain